MAGSVPTPPERGSHARDILSPGKAQADLGAQAYSIDQIANAVVPVLAAINGGPVDPADARMIASMISPGINNPASGIPPGSNLMLNSDFIRRVAERKGAGHIDDQDFARKQMFEALKNANVSSSVFAAALGKAGFGSAGLFVRGAQLSEDAKSSGRYSGMKDASAADQAGSAFARQIGADPAYARLFAGASPEGLNAIADFIRNGRPGSDDDIHTIKDAQAWIGAIRAGKIDPNDPNLPPAIKKIIAGMRKEGIDPATADPKEIEGYFKKHPDALREAQKAAKADIQARATLTEEEKAEKSAALAARLGADMSQIAPKTLATAKVEKPDDKAATSKTADSPKIEKPDDKAATKVAQPKSHKLNLGS